VNKARRIEDARPNRSLRDRTDAGGDPCGSVACRSMTRAPEIAFFNLRPKRKGFVAAVAGRLQSKIPAVYRELPSG